MVTYCLSSMHHTVYQMQKRRNLYNKIQYEKPSTKNYCARAHIARDFLRAIFIKLAYLHVRKHITCNWIWEKRPHTIINIEKCRFYDYCNLGRETYFLLLIRLLNAAEYNVPLLNIDTIDRAALMFCRQHAPAAKI